MKRRLIHVVLLGALWIGAIAWRLYGLQVLHHEEYRRRAERQQQRVVEIDAPRGVIYDARGRELAVSVEAESAFAVPREIQDPRTTAAALARALHGDAPRLQRLLEADREFVWLERKLDPPRARALRALRLAGVYFLPESKRYYPLREVGAQVLGYVGTDNHGLAGLEAAFDREISGRPGQRTVVRDARRGTVVAPDPALAGATAGQELHLTLDAAIQYSAEHELQKAVEQFHAKGGSAVFLDPRNGAVLAMASYPTFDPNRFSDADPAVRRNRPVMDAFEPGSTFKMVTAAAALDANVLDPDDIVDCEMGGITLADIRIRDWHPFGALTFRDVIARSSNVGAIKIGLLTGQDRLYAKIRAFGFGQPTGIDLPGESAGIVRPLARWSYLAKAYASFGQGISVTPLQMASAFGAVANGGDLLRPYIVAAAGREEAVERLHPERSITGHPLSTPSIRSLERMLEAVVTDGTGKAAAVPGYAVAGKTGTAQKAVGGSYVADRFIGSFVGFAPARHPVVVGMVVLDEPHPAFHGGEVAAPAFSALAREILLSRGLTPEREAPATWPREIPAPENPLADIVVAAVRTEPDSGLAADAVAGEAVPDLSGLTAREALRRTAKLGLHTVLQGRGFVERQEPRAGTPLAAARERIELWLSAGRS